jgi:hypothetical protein
MWEPRLLTTLWAFTACYRDSFIFYLILLSGSRLCIYDRMVNECGALVDAKQMQIFNCSNLSTDRYSDKAYAEVRKRKQLLCCNIVISMIPIRKNLNTL